MVDFVLEEIYAARLHLWELGGGTFAGFCAYLREHPISGVRYADLKPVQPRATTCTRPPRAATRKKAAQP